MALTKSQRLLIIIGISCSFFLAEIAVGFRTKSLALVADAFHYLNDVIRFVVAYAAFKVSERGSSPTNLSFGWQRASLLGAFFNGVFLLALSVSIFLQSIERFVSLQKVENPKLVLIVGCIGLALNILSAAFLHEHDHDEKPASNTEPEGIEMQETTAHEHNHQAHRHGPASEGQKKSGHDFGLMGVLIHVLGDAANNVGVMISAAVIWKARYPGRFYADPAVSMAIGIMIFASSFPLTKKSGIVLLGSVPLGVDPKDVQHDIEKISGVVGVHELHVWRLNQQKALASAHIVVSQTTLAAFADVAAIITECFHSYGIHSVTLQPEVTAGPAKASSRSAIAAGSVRARKLVGGACNVGCRATGCPVLTCCE